MTLLQNRARVRVPREDSFITSQGDTAPKRCAAQGACILRFITSQGDTAPKLEHVQLPLPLSFITSQGDTAPKRRAYAALRALASLPVRVTLLQNVRAPICGSAALHYQSG